MGNGWDGEQAEYGGVAFGRTMGAIGSGSERGRVGRQDANGMAFTLDGGRASWDKTGKFSPSPLAGVGPPINNRVYTVDTATNRLTSVNGLAMGYDAAGNLTSDSMTGGIMTYDAENRLLTALAAEGEINYGALDDLGRPTGVTATITEDMIGTGTPANPSIIPPGWSGNGTLFNEARAHLYGAQLGGSGDVVENLVTLQHIPVNTPFMKGFESLVRRTVVGGQAVNYSSTPMYNGANLVPRGITLIGTGSGGFTLRVTILNPIGR